MKGLIKQLKSAIEDMEEDHIEYNELLLSIDECEYLLKLIKRDI